MNLADLQKVVAAYHQKDVSDLTINGLDMFLLTANNLRQKAELSHNFEYCRCRATLSIDGVTGGDLSSAVIIDPPSTASITSDYTALEGNYELFFLSDTGLPVGFQLGTAFYLYFNSFYNSYIISNHVSNGAETLVFLPAVPQNDPAGEYFATISSTDYTATVTLVNMFSKVREVVAAQLIRSDGRVDPLDFSRPDIPIERDRTRSELDDYFWPINRYPSDAQILNRESQSTLIQRRTKVFIYPSWQPQVTNQPLSVILEAYGSLVNWDSDDLALGSGADVNFFLSNGADWIKWAMIYELNPLFSTFVPRQEGNTDNDPKTLRTYRDQAWLDFTTWDSYQIDANATRSR